jgi:peptidoglycan/LPS O-acetylase OafA/YrhL
MHANSFDFIRFLAAGAVIIGHHTALNGGKEPPLPLVMDTLPSLAVCVFFSLSGYLIFNSLKRDSSPSVFFAARLARIMPNLLFSLIIVSLAMMLWFNNYANLEAHLRYVWHNLWMFKHGVLYQIPGVLEGRPLPGPNGSLWTLPYEFWMYVALFSVFLFSAGLRSVILISFFLFCSFHWISAHPGSIIKFFTITFKTVAFGKLGTYFFAGALVAAFWNVIESRKWQLSFALLVLALTFSALVGPRNPFLASAIALLSILVGLGSWGAWFNRGGDPSYGMYIFGFPIAQLALLAYRDFYGSLIITLVMSIAIGYSTYWVFEQRCMAARGSLAALLRWPFRSV